MAPGTTQPEGPMSARDIGNFFYFSYPLDVKFRTNELNSLYLAWHEGMPEWKRIFEVPELKGKIMGKFLMNFKLQIVESKSEVLEEVV